MEHKLRLYYADINNMGDRLNEMVVRDIFGFDVVRCSCLTGEMSAIGSGLEQFTLHGTSAMKLQQRLYGLLYPRVYVWGTGFINYSEKDEPFFHRDMRFNAVRGELSRRRSEKITGRSLDIPTGDGGILASMLLKERPEKRYRVGIVPHVCDLRDPATQALAGEYDDSILINVKDEPYLVLEQIASCEIVLSSSLHGLIAADSFGIPNRHVIFSDRPLGDGFKFDDYYSAYGVPHIYTDLRLECGVSLDNIKQSWALSPKLIEAKKHEMLSCFPYR